MQLVVVVVVDLYSASRRASNALLALVMLGRKRRVLHVTSTAGILACCTLAFFRRCFQSMIPDTNYMHGALGGVAQWLGRRSVAGGLSLIYA